MKPVPRKGQVGAVVALLSEERVSARERRVARRPGGALALAQLRGDVEEHRFLVGLGFKTALGL